MIGATFDRLTVIEERPAVGRRRRVLCRCRCGTKCVVFYRNLQCGNTRSCGCLRDAQRRKAKFC